MVEDGNERDGRLEVGRSGGEDFLEYLVRTFFQQTELVDVGLSRMLVLGIGWGAMLDSWVTAMSGIGNQ